MSDNAIGRAYMDDYTLLRKHRIRNTHPRICDMQTAEGRRLAWKMFFKNGKRMSSV